MDTQASLSLINSPCEHERTHLLLFEELNKFMDLQDVTHSLFATKKSFGHSRKQVRSILFINVPGGQDLTHEPVEESRKLGQL